MLASEQPCGSMHRSSHATVRVPEGRANVWSGGVACASGSPGPAAGAAPHPARLARAAPDRAVPAPAEPDPEELPGAISAPDPFETSRRPLQVPRAHVATAAGVAPALPSEAYRP